MLLYNWWEMHSAEGKFWMKAKQHRSQGLNNSRASSEESQRLSWEVQWSIRWRCHGISKRRLFNKLMAGIKMKENLKRDWTSNKLLRWVGLVVSAKKSKMEPKSTLSASKRIGVGSEGTHTIAIYGYAQKIQKERASYVLAVLTWFLPLLVCGLGRSAMSAA